MADDCVCTNLVALYSMQSDMFTQLNTNLANISQNLNRIFSCLRVSDSTNSVASLIDKQTQVVGRRLSLDASVDLYSAIRSIASCLVHDVGSGQMENITEMLFNKKYQIENLDLGEVAVSNEIIVESQMWSYVGRGEVGFNDL